MSVSRALDFVEPLIFDIMKVHMVLQFSNMYSFSTLQRTIDIKVFIWGFGVWGQAAAPAAPSRTGPRARTGSGAPALGRRSGITRNEGRVTILGMRELEVLQRAKAGKTCRISSS